MREALDCMNVVVKKVQEELFEVNLSEGVWSFAKIKEAKQIQLYFSLALSSFIQFVIFQY